MVPRILGRFEALKALNLRATNDWWLYLPKQLDAFTAEIALDRIVERTITDL